MQYAAATPAESRGQGESGPCLQAGQLWFSYDGAHYVLRGVDITLERGEVAMILGRSGSGKTTLLRVLKGILVPQRGWVRLQSEDGRFSNGRPFNSIAYVPQTLGLVRGMTALENTLTGALSRSGTLRSLIRVFPKSILEEARAVLARLGLADKMDERVYRLSGGERQRVAIARALMQRPSIILADEFVSQLDPITAEETLAMMGDIARSGVSLLITTHETDVVANHADRLIVMREGRVSHQGPARLTSMEGMLELLR